MSISNLTTLPYEDEDQRLGGFDNPHGPRMCGVPVRSGFGPCQLAEGHTGCHSTVAFTCDGCDRIWRGRPTATCQDAPDSRGDAIKYCFMCVRELW